MKRIASWQLPPGVSSGTWDYVETADIANSYDDYFRQHGMFRLDEEVIARYSTEKRAVIDLGCGTGRALVPLMAKDRECVACDLSQSMLEEVESKRHQLKPDIPLLRIRANLADLDCLQDDSFDLGLCLFSTLGMIRGSNSREKFVQHVRRFLKPGGHFILQVHNYWAHLFDPDGPWWMLRNAARKRFKGDVELGDRFFPYRGIPEMYLHSFSFRELRQLLHVSGFEIVETVPLNVRQNAPLRWPNFANRLRASGWIVVAK